MIVEEDKAPRLGGNLLVQDSDGTSWAITSNHLDNVVIYAGVDNLATLPPIQKPDGSVVIGPVVRLPQLEDDPYKKTGYSSIYAKQTSTGDTGIYVANEKTVGDELITKRKAFVYSLIF